MKISTIHLLVLPVSIFLCAFFLQIEDAQADCNREQAFNRMMQMNKKGAAYQADFSKLLTSDPNKYNDELPKFQDFSTKLGSGGSLLAAGKYSEACALYDSIDREFNLVPDNGKTLKMQDIASDGGRKKQGGCDLTEAAMKMADLSSDFQKAFQAGDISPERSTEFTRATEPIGIIMSESPSKACEMMEKTRKDFDLK